MERPYLNQELLYHPRWDRWGEHFKLTDSTRELPERSSKT